MHSLVAVDNNEIKKTKGVNKNVSNDDIRHKECVDALFGRDLMRHRNI